VGRFEEFGRRAVVREDPFRSIRDKGTRSDRPREVLSDQSGA